MTTYRSPCDQVTGRKHLIDEVEPRHQSLEYGKCIVVIQLPSKVICLSCRTACVRKQSKGRIQFNRSRGYLAVKVWRSLLVLDRSHVERLLSAFLSVEGSYVAKLVSTHYNLATHSNCLITPMYNQDMSGKVSSATTLWLTPN